MMAALALIDWAPVTSAIRYTDAKTPALLEYDYEQVAEAVLKATDYWALTDFERYEILAVETKFEHPLPLDGKTYTLSGILDVELREWATGRELNVDWKTRNAKEFGDVWPDRYRMCWQGRIYSLVTGRRDLEWRGICRETNNVKTVPVTYAAENDAQVRNQLACVLKQMEALADMEVWSKKRPSACGAYGRNCDFKKVCWAEQAPRQALPTTRISPTDMENFTLCAERYRLGEVYNIKLDEDIDDRSALNFGLAFHRGIAAVYQQLKVWQKEGKAA